MFIFLLSSCHICAILNGISGVTIMAAPPLISSAWFPPSERTTATAINQVQLRFAILKNHNIGISGFHHYRYASFCCCCLTVIVGLCLCCRCCCCFCSCFRLQRKNGHSDHSVSSEIRYPLGGGIERNHWRKKSEWRKGQEQFILWKCHHQTHKTSKRHEKTATDFQKFPFSHVSCLYKT